MLTRLELFLASRLLELAGERFSDDGCTDLNVIDEFDISEHEAIELDRKVNEWNSSPEEHDPAEASKGGQHVWVLMFYLEQRLKDEASYVQVKDRA